MNKGEYSPLINNEISEMRAEAAKSKEELVEAMKSYADSIKEGLGDDMKMVLKEAQEKSATPKKRKSIKEFFNKLLNVCS